MALTVKGDDDAAIRWVTGPPLAVPAHRRVVWLLMRRGALVALCAVASRQSLEHTLLTVLTQDGCAARGPGRSWRCAPAAASGPRRGAHTDGGQSAALSVAAVPVLRQSQRV